MTSLDNSMTKVTEAPTGMLHLCAAAAATRRSQRWGWTPAAEAAGAPAYADYLASIADAKRMHARIVDGLIKENDSLLSTVKMGNKENASLFDAVKVLDKENDSLLSDFNALKKYFKTLKGHFKTLKSTVNKLEEENASLTGTVDKLEGLDCENASLLSTVNMFYEENKSLIATMRDQRDALDSANARIADIASIMRIEAPKKKGPGKAQRASVKKTTRLVKERGIETPRRVASVKRETRLNEKRETRLNEKRGLKAPPLKLRYIGAKDTGQHGLVTNPSYEDVYRGVSVRVHYVQKTMERSKADIHAGVTRIRFYGYCTIKGYGFKTYKKNSSKARLTGVDALEEAKEYVKANIETLMTSFKSLQDAK